jgi:hypothetical protein
MAQKHDLSGKFFSIYHAPLPYAKFVLHLPGSALSARKLKFWLVMVLTCSGGRF